VNQIRFEIPSHGSACPSDLEAVDDVRFTGVWQEGARRLSPGEKYEMWISIVTGQATQREAADRYGVDRSVVVTACRVAKQGALDALAASVPGRPGQSSQDAALAAANAEIARLRATVTEQAVALHLHEGKARWD
jgi:transposase-like protein